MYEERVGRGAAELSNLEYWIWFSSLRPLRAKTRTALLERFDGAKEIYFAGEEALRSLEGISEAELQSLLDPDLTSAAGVLRRCAEENVQIITLQDAVYPERLRTIPDAPSVLYVRGRLPVVDAEPVITIVGTRHCSEYGIQMARKLAYEVASRGGVVCTGLAGGIDSRAAEGALMAGGKVIGVLGTAINRVYPSWNGPLYEDVAASGALISEYAPDSKTRADCFPARNRIMAALCVGTVVVEAPLRSGALITAERALDYGRDVFAVPFNADSPAGAGGNNLLRSGAALAENGWDVLREYAHRFPDKILCSGMRGMPDELAVPARTLQTERERMPAKKQPDEELGKGFYQFRAKGKRQQILEAARLAAAMQASGDEKDAAEDAPAPKGEDAPSGSPETAPAPAAEDAAERKTVPTLSDQLSRLNANQLRIVGVMTRPGMHVDDIVAESGLAAASVLSELTMLQIKGFVTQEAGKRFSLNIMQPAGAGDVRVTERSIDNDK